MKIIISDEAARWYENELSLKSGDYVRFFVRYGGNSTIQTGFSLGLAIEKPLSLGAIYKENGINYFIEEADLWYFDSKDLLIQFDQAVSEPIFTYL
ncbi:HesB/YadR/YfhF family protein [Bacillus sp. AGMB 02131]|uniref:HesB/YadR/YfhF family protein n=1 Tax=Peribacillus faecalis TaxID=2772559 RepID=A0A927CT09_9BACI|nr:HesB/YadR/YfhF family protein [Peribacillus faecalis]MBD3107328.1 HesB/YadR/YfhF family protein [Peribacillus faecalis]